MGAMAVAVHRIAIVVGEIIAMHIVDIPVAVVVQTIAGDLGLIDPNVVRQIGMAVIHSGVEHSNQCAGAAAAVPSFWQVDIGIGNTTGLPGVMHPPEPLRPGVGGEIRCRDRDIGLNALKQAAQTGRATVLEARRQQGFGGRIFTTPEFEPPTGGSFDDRGLQCLAQPGYRRRVAVCAPAENILVLRCFCRHRPVPRGAPVLPARVDPMHAAKPLKLRRGAVAVLRQFRSIAQRRRQRLPLGRVSWHGGIKAPVGVCVLRKFPDVHP